MRKPVRTLVVGCLWLALAILWGPAGCGQTEKSTPVPDVPRGFLPTVEIEIGDRVVRFGPFVGYYFKPQSPDDLSRLHFVCFNERSFYTRDLPANAKLFEGDAVLTRLVEAGFDIPAADRINPVYFAEAPVLWLLERPEPRGEFVHFHSCYDAAGPVLTGYWLRHRGTATFTYDMGGRVGPDSPLYHRVKPGNDKAFARIIEFDRGPR